MSKIGSAFCLGNYFNDYLCSKYIYFRSKGFIQKAYTSLIRYSFTNIIESEKLTKSGDKLNSTVIVTIMFY